ncbi:MAG: hypothetical protein R2691_00230 [Solirubrobacterales bacterium]
MNPTITVRGRPGHAEMPQPDWREGGAVNAIEKAVVVLEAVRELRERWAREGSAHPLLVPGELILTVIEGGECGSTTRPPARSSSTSPTCPSRAIPTVAGRRR